MTSRPKTAHASISRPCRWTTWLRTRFAINALVLTRGRRRAEERGRGLRPDGRRGDGSRGQCSRAPGGIVDQIVDGESGLCWRIRAISQGLGVAITRLLESPTEAARLGASSPPPGRAEHFLPDRQLLQHAFLLARLFEQALDTATALPWRRRAPPAALSSATRRRTRCALAAVALGARTARGREISRDHRGRSGTCVARNSSGGHRRDGQDGPSKSTAAASEPRAPDPAQPTSVTPPRRRRIEFAGADGVSARSRPARRAP